MAIYYLHKDYPHHNHIQTLAVQTVLNISSSDWANIQKKNCAVAYSQSRIESFLSLPCFQLSLTDFEQSRVLAACKGEGSKNVVGTHTVGNAIRRKTRHCQY